MAIQFVNRLAKEHAMEIGRELLGRINMQAAVNASQMEHINNWSLVSESAYNSSLQEQVQIGRDSLYELAKELEVIKEEQIRSPEEAAASRKAVAAKHWKMLEVADKNNNKIKELFDALQDKLKIDLEGRLSEEWLKMMMKLLHRTGTNIKSAASTAPGSIPDETGDAPWNEPLAGREPPPVPKSPELPNANRATEAGGDGDAGDGGDGGNGGAD